MLHNVELPQTIRRYLTSAMFWQFRLLRWAATAENIGQEGCREWLRSELRSANQASDISSWLWNANPRYKPLEVFAGDTSADKVTKLDWVNERLQEALRLLRAPHGGFAVVDYGSNQTPTWQKQAAAFWIGFYDLFRSNGLPTCLFNGLKRNKYTSQDFLKEFLARNDTVCVCPVCDSTAYFTILQRDSGLSIYTDIDHYLPKDNYPHLAIHPYNLIPLCHNCNSGVKGVEDPLSPNGKPPYQLDQIWLPYRQQGQGLSTKITMKLSTDANGYILNAFTLKKDVTSSQEIEVLNDILARVYHIPERWQHRIDEISDKLFRRMRDYSRFYDIAPDGGDPLDHFHELLFLFDQADVARDPYTIAMAWLLVYILNAEEANGVKPLMEEVGSWQQKQQELSTAMRNHGRWMRKV